MILHEAKGVKRPELIGAWMALGALLGPRTDRASRSQWRPPPL